MLLTESVFHAQLHLDGNLTVVNDVFALGCAEVQLGGLVPSRFEGGPNSFDECWGQWPRRHVPSPGYRLPGFDSAVVLVRVASRPNALPEGFLACAGYPQWTD